MFQLLNQKCLRHRGLEQTFIPLPQCKINFDSMRDILVVICSLIPERKVLVFSLAIFSVLQTSRLVALFAKTENSYLKSRGWLQRIESLWLLNLFCNVSWCFEWALANTLLIDFAISTGRDFLSSLGVQYWKLLCEYKNFWIFETTGRPFV